MRNVGWRRRVGRWIGIALAVLPATAGGCTAESLRVALQAQQRADQVQQAVFERQHEALRVLLFRDVLRRLAEAGAGGLDAGQVAALNQAWNERDLIEFWGVQHERAKALRVAGVDAKLWAEQSTFDLLARGLASRLERIEDALARQAGATAVGPGRPGSQAGSNEP